MLAFAHLCGLALLAALLVATGGAHVAGLGGFRRLLREHGLVPAGLTAPLAVLVAGGELAVGLAAIVALAGGAPRLAPAVFGAAVGMGGGFSLYLRQLVRAGHTGSCGCSPLASPLSPASFVPAAALAATGVVGLVAAGAAAGAVDLSPAEGALAIGWGVTLAALVVLLPASAPRGIAEARR